MGQSTIVLLGSLVLVALVLAATAMHWRRMRSMRVALQGAGVALFVAGLYVLGFMDLVYAWVKDTWRWILHTTFHGSHMIGLVIGGAGVLVFLIGMLISPVSRAEGRERRQMRQQKAAQVGTGPRDPRTAPAAAAGSNGQQAAPQKGRRPASTSAVDPEDAEIEAILRGRGIE